MTKASPLTTDDVVASVSGHVLHMDTGMVETIAPATSPRRTPPADLAG